MQVGGCCMQAQAASERGSQADVVQAAEELQVSLLSTCARRIFCQAQSSIIGIYEIYCNMLFCTHVITLLRCRANATETGPMQLEGNKSLSHSCSIICSEGTPHVYHRVEDAAFCWCIVQQHELCCLNTAQLSNAAIANCLAVV